MILRSRTSLGASTGGSSAEAIEGGDRFSKREVLPRETGASRRRLAGVPLARRVGGGRTTCRRLNGKTHVAGLEVLSARGRSRARGGARAIAIGTEGAVIASERRAGSWRGSLRGRDIRVVRSACGRSAIPRGALSRTNANALAARAGGAHLHDGSDDDALADEGGGGECGDHVFRTDGCEAGVLAACGYDRRWVARYRRDPYRGCATRARRLSWSGFRPVRQRSSNETTTVAATSSRSACGMAPRGERVSPRGGRGRSRYRRPLRPRRPRRTAMGRLHRARGARGEGGTRGARAVGRGRGFDGAEACACACACGEAEEAFEGVACATRGRRGARAPRRGRRRGGGAGGGRATRRRGGGVQSARTARGGEASAASAPGAPAERVFARRTRAARRFTSDDLKRLDSSIKKNTALTKKLGKVISADTLDSLVSDGRRRRTRAPQHAAENAARLSATIKPSSSVMTSSRRRRLCLCCTGCAVP